jgi:RNA polymerase sigma-70 factor (ECF subfamily)
MAHLDDEDRPLVQLARQGDFAAFESLVSKYERRLYGLALRIVRHRQDAEEVVQQTFVSVIEHLQGFREESTFQTWLMRIATNHALALLRKRSVRASLEFHEDRFEDNYAGLPHPQYIAKWRETPDELAQRRETGELLRQALDELDEKYRLVFLLRDVEGYSTSETAEALNITESNVKVRLLRARLMLRERLTRVLGDEATQVTPHHDH